MGVILDQETANFVAELTQTATNCTLTPTLDSLATANARLEATRNQQIAFEGTATSTLWTFTPSPNASETVAVIRTDEAAGTSTQSAIDATTTATLWTNTPTSTTTSRPTNIPTSAPTINPFVLAETGVTRNAEWTPVVQAFDRIQMVLVPAGCFMMGSEDGRAIEQPVTEYCIEEAFWLDRYEVKQDDFERLGGIQFRPSWFPGDERPVENITWFEARDFCAVRGGRLPTEAEWEYAARGPDGLVFPWGNEFVGDNLAYFRSTTAQVGSHPEGASWVGANDLSGNVIEWTSTIYEAYPYQKDDGRENSNNSTSPRMLRGGDWRNDIVDVFRSTYREWGDPGYGDWRRGFRCVRPYDPSS